MYDIGRYVLVQGREFFKNSVNSEISRQPAGDLLMPAIFSRIGLHREMDVSVAHASFLWLHSPPGISLILPFI